MNTPKNTKRASTLNGPAPAPTNKRKAPKSSVEPTRSPTADEWGIPANKRKAPPVPAAPRNVRTSEKLLSDLEESYRKLIQAQCLTAPASCIRGYGISLEHLYNVRLRWTAAQTRTIPLTFADFVNGRELSYEESSTMRKVFSDLCDLSEDLSESLQKGYDTLRGVR